MSVLGGKRRVAQPTHSTRLSIDSREKNSISNVLPKEEVKGSPGVSVQTAASFLQMKPPCFALFVLLHFHLVRPKNVKVLMGNWNTVGETEGSDHPP